jgi:hypothetical protein
MNQQVVGQVAGLEQRNGGWVAVSIMEAGKQYPKKLSTKKPELIQQAQMMMGQIVTAAFNEVQSDSINPHNGQPYINRYLEALALGAVDLVGMPTQIQPQAVMPAAPVAQPVMQPMAQPMIEDMREMKIMRQAAAKVGVQLLTHLDPAERTLASLVRISEQLVKYFNEGVPWQTAPVQAPQTMAVPVNPSDFDQGPQGDDGIPF